jgi:hypothetical protein
MKVPLIESFQTQDKHGHLKNLLDRQFRNVYNQYNLLSEVMKQSDLLYNHPTAPFLKHPLDMLEHTVCTQCKYYRQGLYEPLIISELGK